MTAKTIAELLGEATALIDSRLADMAARGLTEWDGKTELLSIEEPLADPDLQRSLDYVRRYGRKAGVHLLKPVEIPIEGVPAKDDPAVEVAMRIWDAYNERERRETFRSLCRAALADERTPGLGRMGCLAESVLLSVRLETADPTLRQKIRDSRNGWKTPAEPGDFDALIRMLEESS